MEPVPFDGPHARLSLVFEPASFERGGDSSGYPRATAAYEGRGLRGTARIDFFARAIPHFTRELAAAHRVLHGTATLESEDGDFHLTVTFGDRGHVTLTGYLQPDILNDTKLIYEIETDQSYLNATLLALNGLGL